MAAGPFEGREPPPGGGPAPDQVPDSVVARAKAAFGRRAEGQLAALVFDSLIDAPTAGGDRVLRFEHANGWVEIVVSPVDGHTHLRVRSEPDATRVELEFEDDDVRLAEVPSEGELRFENVPRALMRVRVAAVSGPVYSDWFRT